MDEFEPPGLDSSSLDENGRAKLASLYQSKYATKDRGRRKKTPITNFLLKTSRFDDPRCRSRFN